MGLVILGAFIGAVFATLGGFFKQYYQDQKDKKRNDRNVLIRALDVILTMTAPARESIIDAMSRDFHQAMDKVYN